MWVLLSTILRINCMFTRWNICAQVGIFFFFLSIHTTFRKIISEINIFIHHQHIFRINLPERNIFVNFRTTESKNGRQFWLLIKRLKVQHYIFILCNSVQCFYGKCFYNIKNMYIFISIINI